jgi:formylmethanofuran dehydrogenase subunit E
MGLSAANLLQLDLPRPDKRLLAIVETDGCFADGVSVATGCWLGRRTLRLVDYGKVAVTFVDTLTDRAVRLWPHPLARTSAERYAPAAKGRWEAQLLGYQIMPVDWLLRAECVTLADPTPGVLGQPGHRQLCAECGEEVIKSRDATTPLGIRCRGCTTDRYYRAVPRRFYGAHCAVLPSRVLDLDVLPGADPDVLRDRPADVF